MKIDLDDPNLTAYALGELPEPKQSAVARAVAESPEALSFVQETQQLARLLTSDYRAEASAAAEHKPLNILPLAQPRSFWSDARWMSIGLAAVLAVGAVIAAVAISGQRRVELASARHDQSAPGNTRDRGMDMEVQAEAPTESQPPLVAQNVPPEE